MFQYGCSYARSFMVIRSSYTVSYRQRSRSYPAVCLRWIWRCCVDDGHFAGVTVTGKIPGAEMAYYIWWGTYSSWTQRARSSGRINPTSRLSARHWAYVVRYVPICKQNRRHFDDIVVTAFAGFKDVFSSIPVCKNGYAIVKAIF